MAQIPGVFQKRYPCEQVPEDDLIKAVLNLDWGPSYAEQLRRGTCRIPLTEIPRSGIQSLCILGKENERTNEGLKSAKLSSGAYVNRTGSFLLLVHPEADDLLKALQLCRRSLCQLLIWYSDIISLPELENLTQLTHLDLSWCRNLTALPSLHNLTQLTQLELYECSSLTALPSLDNLKQLTDLTLSGCSSLTVLPSLDSLAQLTGLNLSECSSLTALPSLDNLTQLTQLNLSKCSSLTDLPSLDNLTQLTRLDLSNCSRLTTLLRLENLTHLTKLLLENCCKLTTLPNGIRQLQSLRRLDLSKMHLHSLPDWLPEITERFTTDYMDTESGTSGAIVNLGKTIVDGVDMSIFEQPYEMVVEWFEKRKKGAVQQLNEIKVVFLGDGEAGKSHTIARLMNDGGDPIDYTDKSTPGIVIKHRDYEVDDRKFRVHYWDFGGQEIMHSMHRIFLTKRTMYVVLLNARDDTQGDKAYYWLQNIQSFAPNAPVLLVLNKIDQNPKASVDERTLRAKYPGLTEIVRMSALEFDQEQFNLEFTDVLLKEICKCDCLDAQWPKAWIAVKNRLENMDTHYILGTEYKRICRECQVGEVETELLDWFNDLGVSFCFCDKEDYALKKHVILRPDWITNGLYIILFNDCAGAKNGLIPHESIYELLERASHDKSIRCTLPDASYNQPGDVEYVLGVMRKFQLSLDAGDRREFVPMLCQRESTVDIHYLEKDADTLEFRMEFEYLPDNLLHRLMVERHSELDMTNIWRTGARFELPGTGISAVVVIESETLKFFIRHTGTMHRPNTYLTMLKANTDRIWRRMGLQEPNYQLVYKLDNKTGIFDYEELQQAHEDGESTVYSKVWRRRIAIKDILNQSAPDDLQKEHQLLLSILQACEHIQREPDCRGTKEDSRNRRMRDNLEAGKYNIHDQTQIGVSNSGKDVGELDLMVYDDQRRPWSIIEALRIYNGSTQDWDGHLSKALKNYNPHGVPFLFLVTYVDCEKKKFDHIWDVYQKHIKLYDPDDFAYVKDSFVPITGLRNNHYLRIASAQYACEKYTPTVYHIFVQMDPGK